MARLPLDDALKGNLPHVCLRCGAPTREMVTREFSISPTSYPSGSIVIAAADIVMTRYVTLRLPLCANHKDHWKWCTLRLLLLKWLAAPLLMVTAVWVIPALFGLEVLSGTAILVAIGIIALATILLRTGLLDAAFGPIAVIELTDTYVILRGVSSKLKSRSPSNSK